MLEPPLVTVPVWEFPEPPLPPEEGNAAVGVGAGVGVGVGTGVGVGVGGGVGVGVAAGAFTVMRAMAVGTVPNSLENSAWNSQPLSFSVMP